MPDQTQNLLMPHARPGTDKVGKCRAVARGAGGTWAQLDSTEALCSDSTQENFANKLSGIE